MLIQGLLLMRNPEVRETVREVQQRESGNFIFILDLQIWTKTEAFSKANISSKAISHTLPRWLEETIPWNKSKENF